MSQHVKILIFAEEEQFKMTIDCVTWLIQTRRMREVRALVDCAKASLRVNAVRVKKNALGFLSAALGALDSSRDLSADEIKPIILGATESGHAGNNVIWNMFFQADPYGNENPGRWLSSLTQRKIKPPHTGVAFAHHHFRCCNHVQALKAYEESGQHPIVHLCKAVTYLQYALNLKDDGKRNYLLIRAFASLHCYSERLGFRALPLGLYYYNLARSFHQLGLLHFAAETYNKALKSQGVGRSIERSAAHNLAMIYKSATLQ